MEIFGSYMGRDNSLAGEACQNLCTGYICGNHGRTDHFPGMFQLRRGSRGRTKLIFITLPNVFVNMEAWSYMGNTVLLFMTFASFSTIIAVFENIMSFCMDMFGWDRKKRHWSTV